MMQHVCKTNAIHVAAAAVQWDNILGKSERISHMFPQQLCYGHVARILLDDKKAEPCEF